MLITKIRNIHLTSLLCRASVLTAIGTGLALTAASPAGAERVIVCTGNHCVTVCRQSLANGNTVDYYEGTEITVNDADGTKHKYTCKDGNWVQARSSVLTSGIVAPIGAIQASPEPPPRRPFKGSRRSPHHRPAQ